MLICFNAYLHERADSREKAFLRYSAGTPTPCSRPPSDAFSLREMQEQQQQQQEEALTLQRALPRIETLVSPTHAAAAAAVLSPERKQGGAAPLLSDGPAGWSFPAFSEWMGSRPELLGVRKRKEGDGLI